MNWKGQTFYNPDHSFLNMRNKHISSISNNVKITLQNLKSRLPLIVLIQQQIQTYGKFCFHDKQMWYQDFSHSDNIPLSGQWPASCSSLSSSLQTGQSLRDSDNPSSPIYATRNMTNTL